MTTTQTPLKPLKEDMLEAGWQTNGVYWWFEDSREMSWEDARDLHKGTR